MGGGADEGAFRTEDEGVSAVEDGEGRERVETGVEGAEADGGALQGAFDGAVEAGAKIGEVLASMKHASAGIVVEKSGSQVCYAGLAFA